MRRPAATLGILWWAPKWNGAKPSELSGERRQYREKRARERKTARFVFRVTLKALSWHRPTLPGAKPQVPSAMNGLTTVFGMGTGVPHSL